MAHGRWEVTTARSVYVLDLDAGTMTRHDLVDVATEGASGRGYPEQMALLAVLDCRVGRPMFLLLSMSRSGHLGSVRVTSEVSSVTLLKWPS